MSSSRVQGVPTPLRVAAALVGLQSLIALIFGVFEAASTVSTRVIVGVGTAIFMLAYAAGLAVVAKGLWRAKRCSRGPAVATQLIHLPVAWSFFAGATRPIAAALGTVAIAIIVCIFMPSSMRTLVRSEADQA